MSFSSVAEQRKIKIYAFFYKKRRLVLTLSKDTARLLFRKVIFRGSLNIFYAMGNSLSIVSSTIAKRIKI